MQDKKYRPAEYWCTHRLGRISERIGQLEDALRLFEEAYRGRLTLLSKRNEKYQSLLKLYADGGDSDVRMQERIQHEERMQGSLNDDIKHSEEGVRRIKDSLPRWDLEPGNMGGVYGKRLLDIWDLKLERTENEVIMERTS